MNLHNKLSRRIGMHDVKKIICLIQNNNEGKNELYTLLFDPDDRVAYQAAWILGHLTPDENKWLCDKQSELIDEVLICQHIGKRRLILRLLYSQPLSITKRIDLLDFCLERMILKSETSGVQVLCMKIAYELCLSTPELLQELRLSLDMLDDNLCPAIRSVRKNIYKAMDKGKSMQKI